MRDQLSSVMARHTGLQRLQTSPLQLVPSPAVVWPITLPTNNLVAILGIRFRMIGNVSLSTTPDFPTIGIGWLSTFSNPNVNCVWAHVFELTDGYQDYHLAGSNATNPNYLPTTPPAENDRLVMLVGEFVDVLKIDPYSISAGAIRAEVSYAIFDEWGDLPDVV